MNPRNNALMSKVKALKELEVGEVFSGTIPTMYSYYRGTFLDPRPITGFVCQDNNGRVTISVLPTNNERSYTLEGPYKTLNTTVQVLGRVAAKAAWSVWKAQLETTLDSAKSCTIRDAFYTVPYANSFTIGSDPEVFVVDKKTNEVIPAWQYLPSKDKGLAVKSYHWNSDHSQALKPKAFWDGFQAEFTTFPLHCHAYLVDEIHAGLKAVLNAARAKFPDATLSWESVVPVQQEILRSADEEHVQLGCMPSRNIYKTSPLEGGMNGRTWNMRCAGCHVHYGTTESWTDASVKAALRGADAIGAVAVTALLDGLEHPARRRYYGLPGEYRVHDTRLEYRTLSSTILVHPAVTHFALDMTRQGLVIGKARMLPYIWDAKKDEVREAITNCDAKACRKILEKNKTVFLAILQRHYSNDVNSYKHAWAVTMDGIRNHIDVSLGAMEKAWRTNGPWESHSSSTRCQFGTAIGYIAQQMVEPDKRSNAGALVPAYA